MPSDLVHTERVMWKRLLTFIDSYHQQPGKRSVDPLDPISILSNGEIRLIAHDSHVVSPNCPSQTDERVTWDGLHHLRSVFGHSTYTESKINVSDLFVAFINLIDRVTGGGQAQVQSI
jgi:hypothetical protein